MNYESLLDGSDPGLPEYRRISSGIARAVESGLIPVGTRLPSERVLARDLRSSRTTVVAAYDDLRIRGLVCRQVGRGTFISGSARPSEPFCWDGKVARSALATSMMEQANRDLLGETRDPSVMYHFDVPTPATELFPHERYAEAVGRLFHRGRARALRPLPPHGSASLRKGIAEFVGCSPESVMITSGVQQSLDLVGRLLLDPKDSVIVEQPGHRGAVHAFRSSRAQIIGWDVPQWDPAELQRLVIRYAPKLIYTHPSFHNPTGATMDLETRRELLRIASYHGVPVVEDDTYSALHWKRHAPPSLRCLAGNVVVRVGSFSMILGPGFRIGYIIAPPPIIEHLVVLRRFCAGVSDGIAQQVLAELLHSGVVNEHIANLRAEHKRRYDALMDALRNSMIDFEHDAPDGGIYAWLRLNEESTIVAREAAQCGVALMPGSKFYPRPVTSNHIRICFASHRADEIRDGIAALTPLWRKAVA